MKVGIYYNKNYISNNKYYLNIITDYLGSQPDGYKIVEGEGDLSGIGMLMVLGGDGTILTLATACAVRDIPIMGINYGHTGFLAEFDRTHVEDALKMLSNGDYDVDSRSMLDISFKGRHFLALNDIVLQRSTNGNEFVNTIDITAEIDGTLVDRFTADGLIVSTPTGSTGYSLSAGGSILTPGINAFMLTPICAHSLHSRPVVFSDKSVLKLYGEDTHTAINLVADGKILENTRGVDEITVTKSESFVRFITPRGSSFFEKLLFKLNKWSK
ncbi:MAG: NAD(+)/NADH kinase [Clostridia bacterium]|nr:NAD(+)/NADH kinase [Clostridia bacterium]